MWVCKLVQVILSSGNKFNQIGWDLFRFGKSNRLIAPHFLSSSVPEGPLKFYDLSILIYDSLCLFKKKKRKRSLTVCIPLTCVHFPSHESGSRCICAAKLQETDKEAGIIQPHSVQRDAACSHKPFECRTFTFRG